MTTPHAGQAADTPATIGRREHIATRLIFFVSGCAMATWAPLIPLVKARASLDEATLGILLLCLGGGSIAAMPVAGMLSARIGCRRTILLATLLICLSLPFLATAVQLPLLFIALLVFGAGIGALDCVMNIQAVIVERASDKSMMSGFHGLFSVGNIAGAAGATLLLALGLSPLATTLCVVALLILSIGLSLSGLLSYGSKSNNPHFALPRGIVLFIGILCFIAFLTEGAMLDWSAVFLITERNIDPSYAGLGFTVFATTMTIGRLTGDKIVNRFGGQNVIMAGGLLAALGLLISILAPTWHIALAGYALIGAGCSNIVPVLFSAVGRQKTMPESIAIPAITTMGYAGILVGPAFLGFIAQASSLATAFAGIVILLLAVAFSSRYIRS
jgi:predicted MFS family arabinose efflux permease